MKLLDQIPKIIHLYYGRNSKLSYLQYLTVLSLHRSNPEYKICVYYPKVSSKIIVTNLDENQDKTEYTGEDWFDKLSEIPTVEIICFDFRKLLMVDPNIPEVYKSDFLRYYLLSTVGGIWSDFDILYFNSIEKLNGKYINLYNKIDTVLCYIDEYYYAIGFLASKMENKFFKKLLEHAYKNLDLSNYQSIGSTMLNGLLGDFHDLNENNKYRLVNLRRNEIYHNCGFAEINVKPIFRDNYDNVRDDIIGVHWYNGDVFAKTVLNNVDIYLHSNPNATLAKEIKGYMLVK